MGDSDQPAVTVADERPLDATVKVAWPSVESASSAAAMLTVCGTSQFAIHMGFT